MTNNRRKKSIGKKYVLAIETAFTGSLSVLSNGKVLDGWVGSREISRAEDVLEQIADLLNRNLIEKRDIELIIASKGSGSPTGEKIGSAIAKGFVKAVGCRLIEGDIFEALLKGIPGELKGVCLTAVMTKKNVYCREYNLSGNSPPFNSDKSSPEILTKEAFLNKCGDYENIIAAVTELSDDFETKNSVIMTNRSLAEIIGIYYASDNETKIARSEKEN